MILYINRFYIAMCVLRSISQYIGLMLTDDRVARRVLLEKKLLARQSVIYSFVIEREEKWLWNSFWSFFQKENWELFRKREGFGA